MSLLKKIALLVGVSAVLAGSLSAVALASQSHGTSSPPAVSRISFRLNAHQVEPGTAVTGSAILASRVGTTWAPLAGRSLLEQVDGVTVAALTTDAAGHVSISYATSVVGGHVMRIVYAGDATHKEAQATQGFNVG